MNLFFTLVISITIPLLVRKVHIGYIFLTFGIFTVIGTIFIFFFMRETRGKTQAEIQEMFEEKDSDDEGEKED